MLVVNGLGPVQGVKVGKKYRVHTMHSAGLQNIDSEKRKLGFQLSLGIGIPGLGFRVWRLQKALGRKKSPAQCPGFPETIMMCVQLRIAFKMTGLVRAKGSH